LKYVMAIEILTPKSAVSRNDIRAESIMGTALFTNHAAEPYLFIPLYPLRSNRLVFMAATCPSTNALSPERLQKRNRQASGISDDTWHHPRPLQYAKRGRPFAASNSARPSHGEDASKPRDLSSSGIKKPNFARRIQSEPIQK
jgi:hypothetical protein